MKSSSKKNILTYLVPLILVLLFPIVTHAQTKTVLGAQSSPFHMAPTAEGPGYVTPDSPLYVLDILKQHIRIALAITPLQKAVVYDQIANERFAEFRIEILKNNRSAAYIALHGLRDATFNAGQQLAKALDAGQQVKTAARDINNDIKRHQDAFDDLSMQASGELNSELAVAQSTLQDAKHAVESGLSEDELANAIQDDLAREASQFAKETADSARDLKSSLELLQKQAKEAADANQRKRMDAINEAIKEKNAQLKTIEESKLTADKARSNLTQALQAQAAAQAEEVVRNAEEVAKTVATSQKVNNGTIDTNVVLGVSTKATLTPTITPSK